MAQGTEERAPGIRVGTVLADAYRVDRLIGEGGMGAVYEGTQLRLNKRVAIKVMARELSANPEALARFRREAEVTSGIGHPHIVQVFDFGAAPTGEPFLVMEFLEGEDLDHRIRRVGQLTPADTLHIIKQVAAALIATHAKGIVHRDLKPANIYLLEAAGERDFVKVVDFGISKVQAATTKLTGSSTVMGTPHYMSPEQALGRVDEIDHATDQWALACIAWEALSGACPFVGGNVASILFQVVHEPPASLAAKLPGLPSDIEQVLRRALAKAKSERFPSVAEFSATFAHAVATTTTPSAQAATGPRPPHPVGPAGDRLPPDDGQPPLPTTFTRTAGELGDALAPPRSRARWAWLSAIGGAIALTVGALVLLRPAATPPPTRGIAPAPVVPSPSPSPAPTPPPPTAPAAADEPHAPSPAPSATLPAIEEDHPPVAQEPAPGRPEPKRKPRKPLAGAPTAVSTPAAKPASTTGPKGGSKW